MARVIVITLILCLDTFVSIFTSGNINTTLDEIIWRRIETFMQYCPDIRLCSTYWSGLQKELNQSQNDGSCCQSCDCSDNCGLDCCPDRSGHLETEEALYNAREMTSCIDTRYKSISSDVINGYSFKMVSSCPYKYEDTNIRDKCNRDYDSIDLDVPLRLILPVYDALTDSNYKNIYCAMCHKVDLKHLKFANFKYDCDWSSSILTYIRDLTKTSLNNACNIFFTPFKNTYCDSRIIDRCNVTGRWAEYDQEIEASCLSYTSIYDCRAKNIHCYICNGFSGTTHCCPITDAIGIGRTIVFVHFTMPTVVSCLQKSIYNAHRRSEWNLHCPVGMVLNGIKSTCLPREDLPLSSMYIELSLVPDPFILTNVTILNILLNLTREIQEKVELLVTRVSLGHIQGHVIFKNGLSIVIERTANISLQSIQSIDVQIELLISTQEPSRDQFEMILDATLVFANFLKYGAFKAKFKTFNIFEKYSYKLYNCSWGHSLQFSKLCVYSSAHAIGPFLFYILGEKTEILPLDDIVYIEPEPFCPRVVLPKLSNAENELNCDESYHLSRILTETFISDALNENDTHLFFCHEDYFRHIIGLPDEPNILLLPEYSINFNYSLLNISLINNSPALTTGSTETRSDTVWYVEISCLIVSLLSLSLTLVVYSVFSVLRTLPGMNNMALVSNLIIFQTVCLVYLVIDIHINWLCSFVGVITHFSFVNSFSWMFICTFHMMRVFMTVRNRTMQQDDKSTFISYTIFTTILSSVAVTATISISEIQSQGTDIGYGGIACYIKNPIMIICAAVVPAATVVIVNLGMFFITVFKIWRHPNMSSCGAKSRSNIKIFARLSTITGMTWIFGFVFVFTNLEAFEYLFVLFNAGQGVFILLSFVCNRRVMGLICSKLKEKTATEQTTSTPA